MSHKQKNEEQTTGNHGQGEDLGKVETDFSRTWTTGKDLEGRRSL